MQIPSVYDDTMAPPGHHVMSVWALYAPVSPRDGTWDERREEVGERLIDTLSVYAPNLRDILVDWSLFTPHDLEDRVGLTDGNIRHLDIVPDQFLAQRPLGGWSRYATPIKNLYLCGAGTHPGGEGDRRPGAQRREGHTGGLGVGEVSCPENTSPFFRRFIPSRSVVCVEPV